MVGENPEAEPSNASSSSPSGTRIFLCPCMAFLLILPSVLKIQTQNLILTLFWAWTAGVPWPEGFFLANFLEKWSSGEKMTTNMNFVFGNPILWDLFCQTRANTSSTRRARVKHVERTARHVEHTSNTSSAKGWQTKNPQKWGFLQKLQFFSRKRVLFSKFFQFQSCTSWKQ